ncbi:MAG: protein kinase [Bdellovibrionales bacterium]|nr:protein kinase [Bdellovibrionales bacterium]
MVASRLESFDFKPGFILNDKYEIIHKLGGGWESEVYFVKEIKTGIERTAKFFLPHRNIKNKTAKISAQKLHKLKHCSILIQYVTQENIFYKGHNITFLISEYVDGVPLSEFLKKQKGKRLAPFQALHLLHSLSKGVEEIHHHNEYHGDIHTENIIVRKYGLGFDLKLIDLFNWGSPKSINKKEDVIDMIRCFYDSLGGHKFYYSLPKPIKQIILGLKKTQISKKFKDAGSLKTHIENLIWED